MTRTSSFPHFLYVQLETTHVAICFFDSGAHPDTMQASGKDAIT